MERQANCINELEGRIALQKNMSDQLEIKCDNNEQYSEHTSSIWIHGIEIPENESIDNVMAVVNSCHEKINVPFDRDNWIVYIKLERSTSMKILGKRFNQ